MVAIRGDDAHTAMRLDRAHLRRAAHLCPCPLRQGKLRRDRGLGAQEAAIGLEHADEVARNAERRDAPHHLAAVEHLMGQVMQARGLPACLAPARCRAPRTR